MKILSSDQIRKADAFTIENEPIKSYDLMERASNAFVTKFLELFAEKKKVYVFCGTGNNGGDGLAISRLLGERGWDVSVFVVGDPGRGTLDFATNLNKISGVHVLTEKSQFPAISKDDLIIDGLFGSGLSRPVEGVFKELIEYLNGSQGLRTSIDISSGLFAESGTQPLVAVEADHTITFQVPKLAFFQPSLHAYVGELHVVAIGLDQTFIDGQESNFYLTEVSDMIEIAPVREKFDHKGSAGRLLLVTGSKGKIGAGVLSARAALRAGVGLLTAHTPKCGTHIFQTSVPEAMTIEDVEENVISKIQAFEGIVGVGPGIGTDRKTINAVQEFLSVSKNPLVLDADALNILAIEKEWYKKIPTQSILTPHPGEFKRLVGDWKDDFQKLEMLRSFCIEHQVNVVLKGANSAVCDSNGVVYFNCSGNPGMATAGSGDVLTGIVSSFLAQGLQPIQALKLGVYIHGLAGDLAAGKKGVNGMIASDIIDEIPGAISETQGFR